MRLRRVAACDVDPREYIDGANAAFGHWGDVQLFTWVFRGDAEILFLDDEQGRVVAGSGITWRTLHSKEKAAIITGSWTHPDARGRGAFSRLIQTTFEVGAERNAVVLGFVRAENASADILRAAGAVMHATYYCRSTVTLAAPGVLELLDPDPSMFRSSFAYTPSEWRAQFVERPNAHIECIGRRGAWSAVVERTPEFDRVHALSDDSALPQLAARAAAGGRRLFWFTARRPDVACEWTDGYLGQRPAVLSAWDLQNGDRM